jgi:hypothetical protein
MSVERIAGLLLEQSDNERLVGSFFAVNMGIMEMHAA